MNNMAAKGKKILIVDDETAIIKLLSVRLRAEGYAVETAVDGREALDKLISFQPDLMISDVMMPPPNGLELCRRLRSDAQFKNLPIILLSARSMPADRDEGVSSGADIYLTKPFQSQELLEHIQLLLSR
jgi:DNA-binding response OmpR family regulator